MPALNPERTLDPSSLDPGRSLKGAEVHHSGQVASRGIGRRMVSGLYWELRNHNFADGPEALNKAVASLIWFLCLQDGVLRRLAQDMRSLWT